MKESHTEGPASHGDPESCADARKGTGEALTGAHMGGVLSRDNMRNQGADAVDTRGKQHDYVRQGEHVDSPARSKTSSTYGNSMRENREIPCPPFGGGAEGRAGKVNDRNPAMYGQGKSDNPIVLTKQPNEAGRPAAEAVEGRGLTKENAGQQNTRRTQGRESVPSALERIRRAAIRNKGQRFNALFHHVTEERLKQAFLKIKRNAVPGTDGVNGTRKVLEHSPRTSVVVVSIFDDMTHRAAARNAGAAAYVCKRAIGRELIPVLQSLVNCAH